VITIFQGSVVTQTVVCVMSQLMWLTMHHTVAKYSSIYVPKIIKID